MPSASWTPGFGRTDAPVWSSSADGDRRLLAHRATAYHDWLPDGRLLTPVGADERWLGELAIVEPDTLEERRIDTRVAALNGVELADVPRGQPSRRVVDEDTIVYAVSDGDRTGVWLARLAPR